MNSILTGFYNELTKKATFYPPKGTSAAAFKMVAGKPFEKLNRTGRLLGNITRKGVVKGYKAGAPARKLAFKSLDAAGSGVQKLLGKVVRNPGKALFISAIGIPVAHSLISKTRQYAKEI